MFCPRRNTKKNQMQIHITAITVKKQRKKVQPRSEYRHQEEEETDKSKKAQTKQTYEKH